MTIVSNTSPISNLAALGHLSLLEQVYGNIVIPQAVANEIAEVARIYAEAATVPYLEWISIQPVTNRTIVEKLLSRLDEGEAEAIALAIELNAELLLMDEQLGRQVAKDYEVNITGLLGVLLEAKSKGIISEVKSLMNDLIIQAKFRVGDRLYKEVLHLADE